MRTFAATIGITLFLVAIFNIWVDPGSWWHRVPAPFAGPLPEGSLRVFPINFDQRQMKISLLKTTREADLILFGSSRGMLVERRMFRPGLRLSNLSVGGATIPEYAAFWQAVREMGQAPKFLVIFLDPWIFNANMQMDDPYWLYQSGYYARFRDSIGLPLKFSERARAKARSIRSFGYRVVELFTWPMLLSSIKSIEKPDRLGVLQREIVVEEAKMPDGFAAYRGDGSYVYPPDIMKAMTQEEVERLAADEPKAIGDLKYQAYAQSGTEKNLLLALAHAALSVGTQILLISPPLHETSFDRLSRLKELAGILPDFRTTLSAVQKLEPRLSVCDLTEAAAAGCERSEFGDGLHMTESCAFKVLKKCFGRTAGWERLVPTKSGSYGGVMVRRF